MKAWPLGRFWVSGGQSFCYFAILPSRASNLEEEWGHFVMLDATVRNVDRVLSAQRDDTGVAEEPTLAKV
ncbi:unnamed protein product [Sphagnum jensenii]|uniref:Uncharacterized protein n=1 Tax=Sphagnum jensenii TaxID=128206 RepID=A0ABP0WZG3_9BRYO